MGFLGRLFGQRSAKPAAPEHALIIRIRLANDEFGDEADTQRLTALQDQLEAAIARVGEFDGDEWGEGYCTIYMYGPDADALWTAAAPALNDRGFRAGSAALKRYGPPNCGKSESIALA